MEHYLGLFMECLPSLLSGLEVTLLIAVASLFFAFFIGIILAVIGLSFGPDRADCLQLLHLPGTWHPSYDLCPILILWSRSVITYKVQSNICGYCYIDH